MDVIRQLHLIVEAVCPIDGVSIGRKDDKSTWRIDFKTEATPAQQQAARDVVLAFDVFLKEREIERLEERQARRKVLLEAFIDTLDK